MTGGVTGDKPTDPEVIVRLRGDPLRVVRLSRKAIGAASAAGLLFIGGALIFALRPVERKPTPQIYGAASGSAAESIVNGPKDYAHIPKLGPPLPGDLGRPILAASDHGAVAALPPPVVQQAKSATDAARRRGMEERAAARSSRVFFADGSGEPAGSGTAIPLGPALPPAAVPAQTSSHDEAAAKKSFLERPVDRRVVSSQRLTAPVSNNVVMAGSVIPAALVTGIRSDLPGPVTAQVTRNVYDSVTGRIVLIPQGARLLGDYDADVATGQDRVLLAWNRLIFPDGRSIILERQPVADPSGYAGLKDSVNDHWGRVMKAALVSTVLGIGAELGSGNDSALVRALRQGSQDSVSRAGQQVVSRELAVKPTITIRPGYPVRVLVTRDLVLDLPGAGS